MKIELTAFPRTVQGTGASRRLRRTGKVPGIVYGANKSALPIEIDHQALYRHLKIEAFHSSILDMTLEGAHQQVLLRDVQMHPFKQQVLHIDFQRIDKNQKIHMKVPLHFVNADTAPGVKLGGGIANHIVNEIEVQCLPAALPEFIEVDLGKLELGQSVHVNDIALPEGVELISRLRKENPGIAVVQLPKVMVVEEEAAAPVTEIITEKAVESEATEGKDGAEKKDAEKKDASKKD